VGCCPRCWSSDRTRRPGVGGRDVELEAGLRSQTPNVNCWKNEVWVFEVAEMPEEQVSAMMKNE